MRKLPLLLFLLYAKVAFGQVTYSTVTIAFPHIVAGGDPNGGHYVTLLQIVNNNSAATTGHVSMFSDSGTPLAVLFDTQGPQRSEEHTSELQSQSNLVCRLLLEKKKQTY